MSRTNEFWFDEDDEGRSEKLRSFDFQCAMGRVPVATRLTVRQVRRTRSQGGRPLTITLPHAYMLSEGFYKGIVTGGSESIDINLYVRRLCDPEFPNDQFRGIGRVFPVTYDRENDEHPKLQLLVFDPVRSEWYLSCGGMRHCYWCQSDRECEQDIRLESSILTLGPSYGLDPDDEW